MGEIVHDIHQAGIYWQVHATRLRLNVGYIRSDLLMFVQEGRDVSDVEKWLKGFDLLQGQFTALEIEAFTQARSWEDERASPKHVLLILSAMLNLFLPWLKEMDDIIGKRKAGKHDAVLTLLYCCGSDLVQASAGMDEEIAKYARHVMEQDDGEEPAEKESSPN